jgi:AcrR family transcriptional regulator
MDEIAAHCGLGMGTLYRHFPSKQALLTALVGERFEGMVELARVAEANPDPGEAFEAALRGYLEAAEGDASFQLALLDSGDVQWEGLHRQKAEFIEIITRIIRRAVDAKAVRGDLCYEDFPLLSRGIMSTMYFKSAGNADWRRHLELALDGIRGPAHQPRRTGR